MKLIIKHIALVIAAVIFMVSCESYDNPVGLKTGEVKVKSQEKWLYDLISQQKTQMVVIKEYDRDGNLTKYVEFSESGDIFVESDFSYESGQSTEKKKFYDNRGELDSVIIIECKYGEEGKIIEKSRSREDGTLISRLEFKYDEKGNIIKKKEYDLINGTMTETDYENNYNSDGNLIDVRINPDSNGNYQSRDSLNFNNSENALEIINFGSGGFMQSVRTYFYNEHGLISSETVSTPEGNIIKKYIYEYEYYKD